MTPVFGQIDNPILPEEVTRIRGEFGFGKSEFARALGVTPASIYQWETGRVEPTGSARKLLLYLKSGELRINKKTFEAKRGRPRKKTGI